MSSEKNYQSKRERDQLLNDREVADILGLKNKGTLAVWRSTKRIDLPWINVGRCVRYWKSDVYAFLEKSTTGGAA
jgi:hypothetical protein